MEARFVAEGACGGDYAVVWDRKEKRIVFQALHTGSQISDDTIRQIAAELNTLIEQLERESASPARAETSLQGTASGASGNANSKPDVAAPASRETVAEPDGRQEAALDAQIAELSKDGNAGA